MLSIILQYRPFVNLYLTERKKERDTKSRSAIARLL